MPEMKGFERASPALQEILLKLYRVEKPIELEHHLHEFGSVEYHIQSSTSDPYIVYVSISTPLVSNGLLFTNEIPRSTKEIVRGICPSVVEIIEPAKEGYQLTLRLDFAKLPRGKGAVKTITEISSLQATILSSQLKEILRNVHSQDASQGMQKPIKLVYHPREPFFVIKQPTKIVTIFPMRFKEDSDVIIATTFFQELMDVGSTKAYSKAPPCTWSPIPPSELRGELFEDLSTNGGFMTFDISSRHVKGKRLDKTVWSLLNFYALVKYHVKCTRGLIQRRMRNRMESLDKVLRNHNMEQDKDVQKIRGCGCMGKFVSFQKSRKIRKNGLANKIKRSYYKIKIRWFTHFPRRWLSIPKLSSATNYRKLD